jgi:hypothetical protein
MKISQRLEQTRMTLIQFHKLSITQILESLNSRISKIASRFSQEETVGKF